MKVWFGTTTSQLKKYRDYYFGINNYLKQNGCILPYDWLEKADRYYDTPYKERNIDNIYRSVVDAIDQSDAVIIEYTVPNFSSSHQINYALLKKKPTLVLRLAKDNPRFSDSYLEAIQSPLLKHELCTLQNYKEIIDEFLGDSQIEKGNARYNIVLSKKQKDYLDWISFESKKSRSLIIRDLINERMQEDFKYKKVFKKI